jgi:SAM-dependent methyltransferase
VTRPAVDTTDASRRQYERFCALLETSMAQDGLMKLVLAKPQGAEPGLERVVIRPLALRGESYLSFLYHYATRDITKNLAQPAGVARLRELLGPSFRNAHLLTCSEEAQLSISKKGQCTLTVAPLLDSGGTPAPVRTHDREKQRWLDLSRPFLVALGVTTTDHQLIPAMSRKWKQINKFVEVFAHALASSPLADAKRIKVVDFGSGKGYLTFAIHEWLRHVKGLQANVAGVELRPDMVGLCNGAVAKLGVEGLSFEQGDVRTHQPAALDVMIALHACDVATDHAIHLGIRAGAAVIMCSPCCHKQIRPQLLSPHPMQPVLQHGVHVDQQAEMLTDSLRALLLDACGYDTQVFEFISLEHTNKNKMILAVKRSQTKPADAALAQIDELKRFFGIREQCLESLLKADGSIPASRP